MEFIMTKAKNVKPAKAVRLKAWEPIFQVLMTGEVVKKEVFENLLGEHLKYKLSAHILEIRLRSGATIRVVKDGRKVESYQLMNPTSDGVVKYWRDRGIVLDAVKNLKDLQAKPAKETEVLTVTEVTEPNVTA
jgi:hypothetical protein